MHSKTLLLAQVLLRLALATTFLSAVADRFGFWGMPGSPSVSWGNWENFVRYSNSINSYVSPVVGEYLAAFATGLEVLFALLLVVGYKLRVAAWASALLLLSFALSMTVSFGIKAPLDYSVWVDAAACFLLGALPSGILDLDHYLAKQ